MKPISLPNPVILPLTIFLIAAVNVVCNVAPQGQPKMAPTTVITLVSGAVSDVNKSKENPHNVFIANQIPHTSQPKKRRKQLNYDFIRMKPVKSPEPDLSASSSNLLLHLITLLVITTIIVILVCFAHKWRENQPLNQNYPKVEYSMLRQGEDEPEDPLAEILVNVGLAAPEDLTLPTESDSESENSQIASIEPSECQEKLQNGFITIPVETNEDVNLMQCSYSDEELIH